jgi:cysteinyl-tRNA synthetase
VREVLQSYPPEVVRMFILSSHYRGPLNYADENLDHAKASLTRLYTALRGLPMVDAPVDEIWKARFEQAMDDDFNTPEALAVLFELAREINRLRMEDEPAAALLGASLRQLSQWLGLLQADPEAFLQGRTHQETVLTDTAKATDTLSVVYSPEQVESLIAERTAARKSKNWAEADRIRTVLQEAGIVLEDTPKGTIWRRE